MIERLSWSPAWVKKEKGAKVPVFFLRPGSVLERDEFEGELEGRYNAAGVLPFQLREIAREGIKALADNPDDAELMIELIERDYTIEAGQDGAEALSAKDRARMKDVTEILQKHWPDYRAAREQNARHNNYLPTLAFMRWCDGWENVTDSAGEAVPYERDDRGDIPDAVLRRVPAIMMRAAGFEAYQLQYGRAQAKN